MKITIIADNYVDTAGLVAEHGFACLAETSDRKILFDTGQGSALLNNMKRLNIPKEIDLLVFSHGHYDHTGGLTRYFDELSEYTSDIYASAHIFDEHLKKSGDVFSFIGFGNSREEIEQKFRLHLNSEMAEIFPGIFLSGPVKRYEDFNADGLLYAKVDGEYGKDMFRDEQYMVVKEAGGIHVVTGCTHCGAVNLLRDVRAKFAGEKLLSVTGGLHMFRSDESQLAHVVDFLKDEDVASINTGHCTGLDAAMYMKGELGRKVSITKAGMVITL